MRYLHPLVNWSSLEEETKGQLKVFLGVAADFLKKGEEKSLLIVFQNTDRLRPGGGQIETIALVSFQGEKVSQVEFFDAHFFDLSANSNKKENFPDILSQISPRNQESWQVANSNWWPDFPQSAQLGLEVFNSSFNERKKREALPEALVAISRQSLKPLLKILGSVEVVGWRGEISHQNVLQSIRSNNQVKYQLLQPGESRIPEKEYFNLEEAIWRAIWGKFSQAGWEKKSQVLEQLTQEIKTKDLRVYFVDSNLQARIKTVGWAAPLSQLEEREDYLLVTNTNLDPFDNDRLVEISFQYQIDLSQEPAQTQLSVFYWHHGRLRDEFTSDYHTYLKIYLPPGSQLLDSSAPEQVEIGEELGRKYFATRLAVPLGKSQKISFDYQLPWKVNFEDYLLQIQKQSGIDQLEGEVEIIGEKGESKTYQIKSRGDIVISP